MSYRLSLSHFSMLQEDSFADNGQKYHRVFNYFSIAYKEHKDNIEQKTFFHCLRENRLKIPPNFK